MHRRMSLGFALMWLVVCLLAGAVSASAEPLSGPEPTVAESFGLLDWAWEWLTSLMGDAPTGSSTGGGDSLNEVDGGAFIDPLGSTGNG
jgi:hypothetical protein